MPISQTDQLFRLVKSLSKAEKRNFTLFSKRIQGTDTLKFLQLFDLLDKQDKLDEGLITKKLKGIDKSQLSNLKRHLYKQIVTSLRMIYIQRDQGIKIREHIDFAKILYMKGLYLQSLKILQMARNMAIKHDQEFLLLEITEEQKFIEARHITRTGPTKNIDLVEASKEGVKRVSNTVLLSNLKIIIHGRYIKNGHVKNKIEYEAVKAYFESEIPDIDLNELSFKEKIYYHQSYVWYYYILQDFENCYKSAHSWVNIFKENKKSLMRDPDLLMRGYHYVLMSAYNLRDIPNFHKYNLELDNFRQENYSKLTTNSKVLSFYYVHNNRFNKHFLDATFSKGVGIIPSTLRRINRYKKWMDPHRTLVLYFKIAWMYFGHRNPAKAIDYLNDIINTKFGNLREDIQGYSRLLFLMSHYEMNNYDVIDYVMNSVESFFEKMQDKNKVQKEVIVFFKSIVNKPSAEHKIYFSTLLDHLKELKQDPFEKRAFLYLDVYNWTKSKVERTLMTNLIRKENQQGALVTYGE